MRIRHKTKIKVDKVRNLGEKLKRQVEAKLK